MYIIWRESEYTTENFAITPWKIGIFGGEFEYFFHKKMKSFLSFLSFLSWKANLLGLPS
jgi:hypothetical protein